VSDPHDAIYVLTADRTLMGDYRVLFDGMVSASQTTATPAAAMRWFVSRRMPASGGAAVRAPMGLRRIEAALAAAGASPADVRIVAPEDLASAVGPRTKVVALSSGDPLGRGMNDGTMRGLSGGRTHIEVGFARLIAQLAALRAGRAFKVLFGGPGAWQLLQQPDAARRFGIDVVFSGYGEPDAPAVFARLAAGEPVPPVVEGRAPKAEEIPPILGPTSMGVVEVGRGCGWGCAFCTMAGEPMIHLPIETILADATTNVKGGVPDVSLVSEDIFRYGAVGRRPDAAALLAMLEAVRSIDGLRLVQLSHVNVASVMAIDDATLRAARQTISRGVRHEHLWVNLGVESAAGELIEHSGGRAKLGGCKAADWGEFCREAVLRLIDAGFLPMVSLMLGLPGETEAHVRQTLRWVRRLADRALMVFPLFHAPLSAEERPFTLAEMTEAHWQLLRACYALNFRWGPRMYQDNLRAAGQGRPRRALLAIASAVEVLQMKARFALRSRRWPA
jgi:radical SAM superfamily enzyme YgiQ (UPF0313 family)